MRTYFLFAAAAALGVIWNIGTSLRIYSFLRGRDVPASFLLLRMMAPKYALQYKQLTMREQGKPGPLFYHWIISINLALVFAVAALVGALRS